MPTKEQIKTFRSAGDREYQVVARARAAETKAKAKAAADIVNTSEDTKDNMTISLSLEDNKTCNFLALSVEDSADEAMCL